MFLLRAFALSLVMMLAAPLAFADNGEIAAQRPATASFELLGRGALYSFDFDYAIKPEFSLGVGLSFWSVGERTDGNTTYSSASLTIIPIYGNYYFYNSGSHRFYATVGIDIVSAKFSNSIVTTNSGALFTGGAGYEYRGDSGFLFRGALYLIVSGGAIVWPGFSFGYAF